MMVYKLCSHYALRVSRRPVGDSPTRTHLHCPAEISILTAFPSFVRAVRPRQAARGLPDRMVNRIDCEKG